MPLAGPSRTVGLVALEVARRPVVQDRCSRRWPPPPAPRQVARRRVDQRRDLQLVVELRASRAAPRPGRPGRGSPRRSRSRRSAGGTTPPGPRRRGAPTSSPRGARRRRSRAGSCGARIGGPKRRSPRPAPGSVGVVVSFGGASSGRSRNGSTSRRRRSTRTPAREHGVQRGQRHRGTAARCGPGADPRGASRRRACSRSSQRPSGSAAASRNGAPAGACTSRTWAIRIRGAVYGGDSGVATVRRDLRCKLRSHDDPPPAPTVSPGPRVRGSPRHGRHHRHHHARPPLGPAAPHRDRRSSTSADSVYISGMPGPRDWYANLVADPQPDRSPEARRHGGPPGHARARSRIRPSGASSLRRITRQWRREAQLDRFLADSPLIEVIFGRSCGLLAR